MQFGIIAEIALIYQATCDQECSVASDYVARHRRQDVRAT